MIKTHSSPGPSSVLNLVAGRLYRHYPTGNMVLMGEGAKATALGPYAYGIWNVGQPANYTPFVGTVTITDDMEGR